MFEHENETETALPPPPGLSLESFALAELTAPDDLGDLVLSFPLAEKPDLPVELTSAERDIVQGLLDGLTNVEIARRRGVSQFTVANQVAAIFAKLSVHSRLGLALLMRRAA